MSSSSLLIMTKRMKAPTEIPSKPIITILAMPQLLLRQTIVEQRLTEPSRVLFATSSTKPRLVVANPSLSRLSAASILAAIPFVATACTTSETSLLHVTVNRTRPTIVCLQATTPTTMRSLSSTLPQSMKTSL